MWLSRSWIILLAVVGATLLALALMAPGPGSREMAKAHGYKLDLIQHNAHLLLKLDARHAIDAAASLARDARIVGALAEAAATRTPNLQGLQAKANAAMLDLLSHFGDEDRPELFIVVDSRGKQLARIGPGEGTLKPGQSGLSGFPLVEAALRGYLRDDSWSINGRLYGMAAAPVISRNGARYLGALLIGQEVNRSFARQLKGRLVAVHETSPASPDGAFLANTDIAFFLRGKMMASTTDFEALRKLPLQYSKRRDKLLKAGRSVALRIGQDSTRHLVVMAPLNGEAFSHDAFYAVLTPAPSTTGLWAALGRARFADLGVAGLIKVLGTLLALLIVGLLIPHLRLDVPHGRLLDDLRRLSRGDLNRLPHRQYLPRQGDVALLVNEAVERVSVRRPPPAAPAKGAAESSAAQPLGPPAGLSLGPERDLETPPSRSSPPPPSGTFDARGIDFRPAHGGAMPPLAQAAEPLPPLGSTQPPMHNVQPAEAELLEEGLEDPTSPQSASLAPLTPMTGPLSVPDPPVISSVPPLQGDDEAAGFAADLPLLKPVDLPTHAEESDTASDSMVAADWNDLSAPARPQTLAPLEPMAPPPPAKPASSGPLQRARSEEESETVMSSVPEHLAQSLKESETQPASDDAEPLDALGADDDEEAHFRQIYREFVAVKRSCGENTDKLTYDRFVAKLRKNSQSLVGKYNCQAVRFKVYVKDGKAALKATPVQS